MLNKEKGLCDAFGFPGRFPQIRVHKITSVLRRFDAFLFGPYLKQRDAGRPIELGRFEVPPV